MSATTGYYVAGDSWLHRRNPLTKLIALALVLLMTFLLPPLILPILIVVLLVVAWTAGLLRPTLRALRIPALSPGWQASFRGLLDGTAGSGNAGLTEQSTGNRVGCR